MGVAALLDVTSRLDARRMFERSVKLSMAGMQDDRGLVSMDKRALYPGPVTTLTETCAALGMSDIQELTPHLKEARSVHFGSDGDISKCYLEFAGDATPSAGLIFLALKCKGSSTSLNKYRLMRQTDAETWLISHMGDTPIGAAALQVIGLAQRHDPDNEAVVLHVSEDGTDRESIDISVADAALSLNNAVDLLAPVFDHFYLDMKTFLDREGARQFGHLAVGNDQQGQGFVTIYFGAQPI